MRYIILLIVMVLAVSFNLGSGDEASAASTAIDVLCDASPKSCDSQGRRRGQSSSEAKNRGSVGDIVEVEESATLQRGFICMNKQVPSGWTVERKWESNQLVGSDLADECPMGVLQVTHPKSQ